MNNINIGVIGYGYWGPNIVRNFFATKDCTVKMVADGRAERLTTLSKIFPSIQGVKDARDIIENKDIDAIVIATPVYTHFGIAKHSLLAGQTCTY